MSKSEFIKLESTVQLIEDLRKVKLVGLDINPYFESDIEIQSVSTELIFPSAFYILNKNLEKVKQLYGELLEEGIDIFNLSSVFNHNNYNIAPPILEIFDGKLTIVDGQHRIFLAKELGINSVKVITVKNPSMPLAVTPLNWEDVKIHQEVPQQKRIYNPNIPAGEHSKYYRNFSVFGSTGERKVGIEG